ncbi:pilus assembly protein PilM, partial [Candidatus Saccharibacteria bacterium]|nr:pilus assembly protein PilM [Candidatus Saccharibacteria bacterium]
MNLLHGVGAFFSLDIGTYSMRIIQLSGDAKNGWTLQRYAYVPIEPALTADTTELGKKHLGEAIMGAVLQAGIQTNSVARGLPAN